MSFRTQFDSHSRVNQPIGSRVKILYGPVFDKQGHMTLEETGKENLYDFIQSHADSVDIHVLLKQYQSGDPTVLARVQGAYGDFTQMPRTFAEALNTMIAAEAYFNSLSVETRAQFGHNFNQFIASMDDPDFTTRMGIAPEAPVSSSEPVSSAPAPAPASAPETPPAVS